MSGELIAGVSGMSQTYAASGGSNLRSQEGGDDAVIKDSKNNNGLGSNVTRDEKALAMYLQTVKEALVDEDLDVLSQSALNIKMLDDLLEKYPNAKYTTNKYGTILTLEFTNKDGMRVSLNAMGKETLSSVDDANVVTIEDKDGNTVQKMTVFACAIGRGHVEIQNFDADGKIKNELSYLGFGENRELLQVSNFENVKLDKLNAEVQDNKLFAKAMELDVKSDDGMAQFFATFAQLSDRKTADMLLKMKFGANYVEQVNANNSPDKNSKIYMFADGSSVQISLSKDVKMLPNGNYKFNESEHFGEITLVKLDGTKVKYSSDAQKIE